MPSLGQVFRNVQSNYARDGVAMAVSLLLTPFLFHRLGPAAYGVVVLTGTTNGLLRLLDGGLALALARFVGRDLERGSSESVRRVVNTALATYLPIGVVAGLAIAALGRGATPFLGVPSQLDAAARLAFVWAGLALALRFWGAAFDGALRGAQRFPALNGILVLERLLYAGGAVAAAGPLDRGPVGVAAALAVAAAAAQIAKALVALKTIPGLRLALSSIHAETWREIVRFGGWASLSQIASFLEKTGIRWLISGFLGSAVLGQFNVLATVVQLLIRLLGGINEVVMPMASAMTARGDASSLRRIWLSGSKLALILVTPPTLVAGILAAPLLSVWVGGELVPLAWVLSGLVAIQWVESSFGTGNMVVLGSGRSRLLGMAYLAGGTTTLTATAVLVGAAGAGWTGVLGALAAGTLVRRGLMLFGVARTDAVSAGEYVLRVVATVSIAAVPAAAAALATRIWVPGDWPRLIAGTAAVSLLFAPAAWWLVLDPAERALLLRPWRTRAPDGPGLPPAG